MSDCLGRMRLRTHQITIYRVDSDRRRGLGSPVWHRENEVRHTMGWDGRTELSKQRDLREERNNPPGRVR